MRNVRRVAKPNILLQKEEEWKRELLEELAKGNNASKKRLDTLYKKYAHPEIRNSLKKMYKYCCYCESRIRHVTTDHIEHRKPKAKDKFPELTFEWDNLHLACPNCNGLKSDQWDNENPILDAVNDIPISLHLEYRRCQRHPKNGSKRGKTTRDHAQLNRDELVEAREELYPLIMDVIEDYNNAPHAPGNDIAHVKLSKMAKGQFGSFVEYLVKTFMINENN